ncbi:unnamed protein product [Echinostoma caproni]|uniref:DUF551 domain-containing protein n=1 Tax=Echinostoma caproni TaxID=27848 RepID=A0A183AF84_9TREM|nr:unnamed protein product [Echinostoma caproni]
MSYSFHEERRCVVLDGYGIAARVPCDHMALPFCEITVDWSGLLDKRPNYTDTSPLWTSNKVASNSRTNPWQEVEPVITSPPEPTEAPPFGEGDENDEDDEDAY